MNTNVANSKELKMAYQRNEYLMHSLDEIAIIPAVISDIEHRSDVNPFYNINGLNKLPIFVAPMTCIINTDNFETFNNSRVIPILPVHKDRIDKLVYTVDWQALDLNNFKRFFIDNEAMDNIEYHILIDCANGHMKKLFDYVREAKKNYHHIKIMIGNIANPDTYIECCNAGVDYVRVGIGGGYGCTTSVQTGIHTSMHWLLSEINKYKKSDKELCKTKVIADGGINYIGKAIKCLALGADYVMMGKSFAKCREACGETTYGDEEDMYSNLYPQRHYYGQSSRLRQLDRFGEVKSHPEGNDTWVKISTTLEEYSNDFEASLRSCMSYCNAKSLNEFIGVPDIGIQTDNEFKSYIK